MDAAYATLLALGRGAAGGAPPPGPLALLRPGQLSPALAFSRASPGLILGADGAWATVGEGLPRFHGASRRLLVEGAATNALRNPRALGAAAGTPGTLPSFWALSALPAGLSREILGAAVEDGLPCLDLRVSGTSTASGFLTLQCENNLTSPTAPGRGHAVSIHARAASGAPPAGAVTFVITERNASGTSLRTTFHVLPGMGSESLRLARKAASREVTMSGAAFLSWSWRVAIAAGETWDTVLRIGAPQVEDGEAATSPILPPEGQTGLASRAADLAAWTPAPGSLAQGTLVLRALLPGPAPAGAEQGLLQLDDGGDQGRIVLRGSASGVEASLVSGSATLSTIPGGAAAPGAPFRAVLAWDASGATLCLSGGPARRVASAVPAGLSRLLLGHGSAALDRPANGELELLDHHPARLGDAEVAALAGV